MRCCSFAKKDFVQRGHQESRRHRVFLDVLLGKNISLQYYRKLCDNKITWCNYKI